MEKWGQCEDVTKAQLNLHKATLDHPYGCSHGGSQSKQKARKFVTVCAERVSHCFALGKRQPVSDIKHTKHPRSIVLQFRSIRTERRDKLGQADRTPVIKESLFCCSVYVVFFWNTAMLFFCFLSMCGENCPHSYQLTGKWLTYYK